MAPLSRLAASILVLLAFSVPHPCAAALSDTEILQARVKTLWTAITKSDHETAYDFQTPDMKAVRDKEAYVTQIKSNPSLNYLSYSILDTEVSGDLGWVKIAHDVQAAKYPGVPSRRVESWTLWKKLDGQWYALSTLESADYPSLPPKLRLQDEEARLKARADGCWSAMVNGDWKALYSFLNPAFTQTVTLDEFLTKEAANVYVSHRIEWAEVSNPLVGKVRVVFTFRPNDPHLSKITPQEKVSMETWQLVDGEWYRDVAPNQ